MLSKREFLKATGAFAVVAAVGRLVTTSVEASTPSCFYYTVQEGDTLTRLGNAFGRSVKELAETNGITNPNLIKVGERIKICAEGGVGGNVNVVTQINTQPTPVTLKTIEQGTSPKDAIPMTEGLTTLDLSGDKKVKWFSLDLRNQNLNRKTLTITAPPGGELEAITGQIFSPERLNSGEENPAPIGVFSDAVDPADHDRNVKVWEGSQFYPAGGLWFVKFERTMNKGSGWYQVNQNSFYTGQ